MRIPFISSSSSQIITPSSLLLSTMATGLVSDILCGMSKEKTDPLLYSLSTFISPPQEFMIFFVMERPNPEPSIFRLSFILSSTLAKSSKRAGSFSSFIPMPVSFTSACITMLSIITSLITTLSVMCPFFVYFTALLSILIKTCLIRTMSPYKVRGM